jgi:hypothetical protein
MRYPVSIAVVAALLAAAPASAVADPPTVTPPDDPTFQGASFCSLGANFAHQAIGIEAEPGASDFARLPPDSIPNCTGPHEEQPPVAPPPPGR